MSKLSQPPFASRTDALAPFLAMEVMERAFEMERDGTQVSHLEIGEPDFPPPEVVIEACTRALRSGETHYSDSRGLVQLRAAIAADLAARFRVSVDPDRVLVLDLNYTNNSRRMESQATLPAVKWASKWLVWMQDLLLVFGGFV